MATSRIARKSRYPTYVSDTGQVRAPAMSSKVFKHFALVTLFLTAFIALLVKGANNPDMGGHQSFEGQVADALAEQNSGSNKVETHKLIRPRQAPPQEVGGGDSGGGGGGGEVSIGDAGAEYDAYIQEMGNRPRAALGNDMMRGIADGATNYAETQQRLENAPGNPAGLKPQNAASKKPKPPTTEQMRKALEASRARSGG